MADITPLRASPADADPPADPAGPPLVVDARRLAEMLCASVRSVRKWDAAGVLPRPIRIGGRVFWRRAEIFSWIDAGAPDRATWESRRAARS